MSDSIPSVDCNSNSLAGIPSLYQTLGRINDSRRLVPPSLGPSFLSALPRATSRDDVLDIVNRALQIVELTDLTIALEDDDSAVSLHRATERNALNGRPETSHPRHPFHPTNWSCHIWERKSGACTLFSQICIRINLLRIFNENQIRKNIRKILELGRLIEKLGSFLIFIRKLPNI